MPKELVGLVINPKKKSSPKRSSGKKRKSERRRPSVRARAGRNVILITNPSRDTNALLELSLGAAVGMAGGKLIDRALPIKLPLPVPVSTGDLITLGGGLILLKNGGRRKEFAMGVVAGAGAKVVLNLIDNFLFHNKGVVSLHGEDYVEPYPEIEPLPEEPVELGQVEPEPVIEPEVIEEAIEEPELQTL